MQRDSGSASPVPRLLAETADFWAVAKPPGWLVIPGRHPSAGTPVLRQWLESDRQARAWVVHRIDRETSGVVLFARSAEAHARANRWFESHQVKKEYDLIASGRLTAPMVRCHSPIEGKPSLTLLELKFQGHGAFLGRARLATGRRHQIRIHLSRAGHPLLGDSLYGGPVSWQPAPGAPGCPVGRVALHASRLELPEKAGAFEAPWPPDFAGWVETLRAGQASAQEGAGREG